MPVATTSAAEAATKTVSLLTAWSEAKSSVASCVLSPSSARKTDANTTPSTFTSITVSWYP